MSNYCPTIGVDFSSKILDVGTKVKLLVWDTAGQERFRTITKNYYRDADAHLLIFDDCFNFFKKRKYVWHLIIRS